MSRSEQRPAVGTERPARAGEFDAGYHALRDTVAARLIGRDVLSVSGPDTTDYLQGQCSQEVAALADGDSAEALLLSPQGKVEVYLRLTKVGDQHFLIDTDEGFGAVATARLERFRLRMKVDIEPRDWICVGVRGPEAAEYLLGKPQAVVVAPVAWPGFSGVDLLGPPPPDGPSRWIGDDVVRCGPEAWEAARIEAGMPRNGREIGEGTIAAEVGLVDRTVSFTKGCFTGQELVARLDARGSKVARRLSGVVFDGPAGPAETLVGGTVLTADEAHEVGRLSSVAWSPGLGAHVALAVLHRRVTPPAAVVVRWTGDDGTRIVPAESRPLPLAG
jgi:folate-binding protein YgfZ